MQDKRSRSWFSIGRFLHTIPLWDDVILEKYIQMLRSLDKFIIIEVGALIRGPWTVRLVFQE